MIDIRKLLSSLQKRQNRGRLIAAFILSDSRSCEIYQPTALTYLKLIATRRDLQLAVLVADIITIDDVAVSLQEVLDLYMNDFTRILTLLEKFRND